MEPLPSADASSLCTSSTISASKSKRIPVSAIIPCAGRIERLKKTLHSIDNQSAVPSEIIVIDGSPNYFIIKSLVEWNFQNLKLKVVEATKRGAAVQREQGVSLATEQYIFFLDDDIDLQSGCIESMWNRIYDNKDLGGCNAMITNQSYNPPGKWMRRLLGYVGCPTEGSLAGRCCGPALNFLPADNLHEENPISVQWLNTTCTLYRRSALPSPAVFLNFFHGYSLMEDLALSMHVGKTSKLETLPSARIFHDSVNASYKSNALQRSTMECTNRWFVMTRIMGRTGALWNFRLAIYEFLGLLISLRSRHGLTLFLPRMAGMAIAMFRIATAGRNWKGYP